MRRLLLPAAYYLLFTPYGLVRRIFGDPLARRWDPDAETYLIGTGETR